MLFTIEDDVIPHNGTFREVIDAHRAEHERLMALHRVMGDKHTLAGIDLREAEKRYMGTLESLPNIISKWV